VQDQIDRLKQQAAVAAADMVEPGMVVGLGHGSTAIHAVRRIAERIRQGELPDVVGIPASLQIEAEARALGIPLTDFSLHPVIDVTIDGADEIDSALNLIKGGGGALLREKILAQASQRVIIVAHDAKQSPVLGMNFALPIEVVPFGWPSKVESIKAMGARIKLRLRGGEVPFTTDQGNYILDCKFDDGLKDPQQVATILDELATVVEHGLFLGLATDVLVASQSGISHLKRESI
jgi:ribose 5-phosphate isomerase A